MSSLRKLERSVIMHKSYELCGSSAMFHTLWKKQRDKRVLGKIKSLLGKKKNVATPATAVTTSN